MNHISLKRITGESNELEQLQLVMESAPAYTLRITGARAQAKEAESTLSALPPEKTIEDKFVFGIYSAQNKLIGCIDLIRGYPNEHTAFLGLLMLSEKVQAQGIGGYAYTLAEKEVKLWGTCRIVRLAGVRANDLVLPFWKKLGFRETGELKPYQCNLVVSESILLEKEL